MERVAKYVARNPNTQLNQIGRVFSSIKRENLERMLNSQNFKNKVREFTAGPSRRTYQNMNVNVLKKIANNRGIAINSTTTRKNKIIKILERNNRPKVTLENKLISNYNRTNIISLKTRLHGALKSHNLLTKNKIQELFGENKKIRANLRRKHIYPVLSRLNQTAPPPLKISNEEKERRSKILPLPAFTEPARPKFNLRNVNLNVPLNRLANLALMGPRPDPRSVNEQRVAMQGMLKARNDLRAFIKAQKDASIRGAITIRKENYDTMPVWRYTPRVYQTQLRDAILDPTVPGLLAIHSIGSGKTFSAVLCAHALLSEGIVNHVIVISPKTLVDTFKRELIEQGMMKMRRFQFFGTVEFVRLLTKGFDFKMSSALVIIDEIHNLRTKPTKKIDKTGERHLTMSERIMHAVKKAPKVLGLTATPIVNEMGDIKMPLSIVLKQDYNHLRPLKQDQLIKYAPYISFYERKEDDKSFPSYSIQQVTLIMTDTYRERWKETLLAEPDYFDFNKRHQLLAAAQNDAMDDNVKVEWTMRKIQSIMSKGGKVIVYSEFRATGIDLVQSKLDRIYPGKYVVIHGDVDTDMRSSAQYTYNLPTSDSKCTPIMIITKAGGEGIDLKMTSAVIIIEPPWHPSGVFQVIGRGVRTNSHIDLMPNRGHVNAYLLCAQPSEPIIINNVKLETDVDLYDRIVWNKLEAIYNFYRTMAPHSIGASLEMPYFPPRGLKVHNENMTKLLSLHSLPRKMRKASEIIEIVKRVAPEHSAAINMVSLAPTELQLKSLINLGIKKLMKN